MTIAFDSDLASVSEPGGTIIDSIDIAGDAGALMLFPVLYDAQADSSLQQLLFAIIDAGELGVSVVFYVSASGEDFIVAQPPELMRVASAGRS